MAPPLGFGGSAYRIRWLSNAGIISEDREYLSEEGFVIKPTKIIENVKAKNYDCLILPGTMNPLPALYDEKLIDFLREGIDFGTVFAAISSSPILLSKSGVLKDKKFTAGYFMQMTDTFDFIEKENFIHKGIVEDKNVITGIGMFFREFAEAVLRRFDYDIGDHFMTEKADDFTEEELTFYWSDEDYKEFLDELKSYE